MRNAALVYPTFQIENLSNILVISRVGCRNAAQTLLVAGDAGRTRSRRLGKEVFAAIDPQVTRIGKCVFLQGSGF